MLIEIQYVYNIIFSCQNVPTNNKEYAKVAWDSRSLSAPSEAMKNGNRKPRHIAKHFGHFEHRPT